MCTSTCAHGTVVRSVTFHSTNISFVILNRTKVCRQLVHFRSMRALDLTIIVFVKFVCTTELRIARTVSCLHRNKTHMFKFTFITKCSVAHIEYGQLLCLCVCVCFFSLAKSIKSDTTWKEKKRKIYKKITFDEYPARLIVVWWFVFGGAFSRTI